MLTYHDIINALYRWSICDDLTGSLIVTQGMYWGADHQKDP